ncbi:SH3 domain-containing protein [Bordetella genomosp. 4]|uniref:SH3 domain-containing protein n=1 Tax=Bordetella genomosp. 4 TaxID=463044 RepID=UPI0011781873
MRYKSSNGLVWLCILLFVAMLGNCSEKKTVQKTSVSSVTSTTSTHVAATAPIVDPRTVHVPEPEFFVRPSSLKQRASPNGTVVGSLVRGVSVKVYVRQGDWGRITPDGLSERWVSMTHLCPDRNCAVLQKDAPKKSSAQLQQSTPSSPRINRFTSTYSAGCPCSSSSNCIGPRGGRYCITSGGNKRYR